MHKKRVVNIFVWNFSLPFLSFFDFLKGGEAFLFLILELALKVRQLS